MSEEAGVRRVGLSVRASNRLAGWADLKRRPKVSVANEERVELREGGT